MDGILDDGRKWALPAVSLVRDADRAADDQGQSEAGREPQGEDHETVTPQRVPRYWVICVSSLEVSALLNRTTSPM